MNDIRLHYTKVSTEFSESHIADDCTVSVQIQGTGLDRLDELMNDIRLHYTKVSAEFSESHIADDCTVSVQIQGTELDRLDELMNDIRLHDTKVSTEFSESHIADDCTVSVQIQRTGLDRLDELMNDIRLHYTKVSAEFSESHIADDCTVSVQIQRTGLDRLDELMNDIRLHDTKVSTEFSESHIANDCTVSVQIQGTGLDRLDELMNDIRLHYTKVSTEFSESHIADDCTVSVQIQGTGLDRLDELINDIRLHYTKVSTEFSESHIADDCTVSVQIQRTGLDRLDELMNDIRLHYTKVSTEFSESHIADDCTVSVQIQGTGLDRLDELMNDIRLHYTKATGAEDCVTRPQIGRLYCAKYPADGNWYRAVVKQILPTKKVEVLYVDYGNREVISISNLREPTTANPHITKLPYQSVDCQLAGLSGLVSSKTENSDLSKSLIEMVPTNEAIQIKVLLETKPPTVELYIEGNECSLNELFLQGHRPSLIERFIDGADVPLPSDSETSSATDEVRVPSDHRLNDRRIVIANESHETQKLSQTERCVTLSDDTPDLQVSLTGCHGDGDYSNNNIKQVDNITEQAVERGNVDSLQEDSTSAYDEVKSQGDWQDEIENYDKLPMPSVLTIPDVGEFMDIHVSLVTDPNSFMCQPWSSYDDLNSLVDNMKEFYTNHIYKCPELKIGGFYAALYDDDEHWYRIQLKTVLNEHMVAMYMLDLGHYDVVAVENIQPLVSEFRKLPFQAITASLAGVKAKGDRFSDQAVNRFFELAYRREFVAQIVEKNLIDRETVIKAHLCDTSDDNADVYIEQLLIDEGLCDLDESGR
ncbi:tudor domain-containing protein 7-like [Ptychodera flava]|uniref:tudor domain-containing protein 7-like n=1 Tax=Ptychodera flava TaxID=63121 RepID=UPI003969D08D